MKINELNLYRLLGRNFYTDLFSEKNKMHKRLYNLNDNILNTQKKWKNEYISYLGEEGEHMKIRIHTENVFKT